MKVLIIEDEIRIAKYIRVLLSELFSANQPEFILAGTLEEGIETITSDSTIEIVFLDLNLHGKDGFEVLDSITCEDIDVVICSAYHDKALKAFEYGVLDFIPKPITRERVKKTVSRYFNTIQSDKLPSHLTIRTNKGIERINTVDIIYFKGSDQYSEIHLDQNKIKLHQKSLDRLEKTFNPIFMRVHRSYLVRKELIVKMERVSSSDYQLVLTNGECIPIGRGRVKDIKNLFNETRNFTI
ncbi:MAG: LytTR family DNA-binding domain-containing protein [Bacteroidota bacterium]